MFNKLLDKLSNEKTLFINLFTINFVISVLIFCFFLFSYMFASETILKGLSIGSSISIWDRFLAIPLISETIIGTISTVLHFGFSASTVNLILVVICFVFIVSRSLIMTLFNIFVFKATKSKKVLLAVLLIPYLIQITSMAFIYRTPEYKNFTNKDYNEKETAKLNIEYSENYSNNKFEKYINSNGCDEEYNDPNNTWRVNIDECERRSIKEYLAQKYYVNSLNQQETEESIFSKFFDKCTQIENTVKQNKCFDGFFLWKKYNDKEYYQYLPNENSSEFIKNLLESKESYCSFAYKNVKEKVNACVKRLP